MSLILALVPLALAAVASQLREGDLGQSPAASSVSLTRLRDPLLLEQALSVIGCSTTRTEVGIRAERDGLTVEFMPGDANSGAEAHFAQGTDPVVGAAFLADVDSEFCRLVQEQVYERVLSNAGPMGMDVVSESVAENGAITLTLETRQ